MVLLYIFHYLKYYLISASPRINGIFGSWQVLGTFVLGLGQSPYRSFPTTIAPSLPNWITTTPRPLSSSVVPTLSEFTTELHTWVTRSRDSQPYSHGWHYIISVSPEFDSFTSSSNKNIIHLLSHTFIPFTLHIYYLIHSNYSHISPLGP